jgi:hypothetical protein
VTDGRDPEEARQDQWSTLKGRNTGRPVKSWAQSSHSDCWTQRHRGLRMVMRYAHLSPAYLSAEVSLLDAPLALVESDERARKGQSDSEEVSPEAKVPDFAKEIGSSAWTRTRNPPVNRRNKKR